MPQLDVWVLIATLAGFALYAAACALVYRYADAHAGDTADRRALPIMFAAAAVICILFSCLIENHNDLNTYNSWGQWILQNGVNGFYDTNEMAMPPLFLFLSAGLSGISNVTHIPYRIVYRLVFSAPFRRLQNKTQVFPLPGSIFVHNRLTHSLEVSCVGRSLGNNVSATLSEKYSAEPWCHKLYHLGAITSAAATQ